MTYLLDSNVFIQAKNLHYGFDFCPAFWDWLKAENEKGRVFSIEKVETELLAGNDDLTAWASQLGEKFFLPVDEFMLNPMSKISEWVTGRYPPESRHQFLQGADYYLVAHALARSYTVVTHEIHSSGKRVKIPTVCMGMNIKFLNPYEMLRKEKARFVLQRS